MLKKVALLGGGIVGLCLGLVGGGLGYVTQVLPNTGPPPELTVEATPEVLARGKYLVENVAACLGCHSTRDIRQVGHPLADVGGGGFLFDHDMGFPGVLAAKNITPAGIGDWTDGELLHALTAGETPNHYALFPLMPWKNYREASTADLYAMIAWIRTLEPIKRPSPDHVLDPPLNLIVNFMPEAPTLTDSMPDPSDEVAYGEYLLTMASCNDCHTQTDHGKEIPGMKLAGGFAFKFPGYGINRSANITPDKATGIGTWSREVFVNTFRKHLDDPRTGLTIEPGGPLSVMPWAEYAGMTESDLGAIYAYLQTVEPVENKVVRFEREEGLEAKDLPEAPALAAGIFSKLSVGSLCDTLTFGMEDLHEISAERVHTEMLDRAAVRAQVRAAPDWPAFAARWNEAAPSIAHHGMQARCAEFTATMEAQHALARTDVK